MRAATASAFRSVYILVCSDLWWLVLTNETNSVREWRLWLFFGLLAHHWRKRLQLKANHSSRPLWIDPKDWIIVLEAFSPWTKQFQDVIAEPVCRWVFLSCLQDWWLSFLYQGQHLFTNIDSQITRYTLLHLLVFRQTISLVLFYALYHRP